MIYRDDILRTLRIHESELREFMQSLEPLKLFQKQRVVCQKRFAIGTSIFLGQALKEQGIFIAMIMKMFWKVEFGRQ